MGSGGEAAAGHLAPRLLLWHEASLVPTGFAVNKALQFQTLHHRCSLGDSYQFLSELLKLVSFRSGSTLAQGAYLFLSKLVGLVSFRSGSTLAQGRRSSK